MDFLKNEYFILFFFLINSIFSFSQTEKTYSIRTIAFYNIENLFDTENDSLTYDDDRTPQGKDNWTRQRYQKKIQNMSQVLSEIGSEVSRTSPDIIGICEIENRTVIEDLVNHKNLSQSDYGIVHLDSPDERGIDVAFLYKKKSFIVNTFKSHRLLLSDTEGFRDYTRDQLVVNGYLDDEKIHFIVNHWPSRSGGEARSRPYRMAAAKLNKRIIDSILNENIDAKIISMGDLNDDPIDASLKKILRTKGKKNDLQIGDLFNPFEKLFKKGIGSLAYRDKWNLFDQMFFTSNLLHNKKDRFNFWKAGVYTRSYLIDKQGKYKGYPLRTYAGGSYIGGYSDHFPVYLYLIRESLPLTSMD